MAALQDCSAFRILMPTGHGNESQRVQQRPFPRYCPAQQRPSPRYQQGRGLTPPVAKMYVPSDSFGGRSPERKAADALHTFFTFCSARIVLAQLAGGGEGGDLPPTRAYVELYEFMADNPMTNNGDEWLAKLVEQNQMLGVRVMEVREAYCTGDFDWEQCRELASSGIKSSNVQLLRQYATQRFSTSLGFSPGPSPETGPGGDWDQSCNI